LVRTIESKFGLLRYTENQKTLFAAQRLLGAIGAWWANFTATLPIDQVQWAKFHKAFWAQHIPVGIMLRKHHEFMDLKQCGRTVYDYSKLFNHLA
jgi:tellurite resistance protein TehA-like permease